MMQRLCEHCGGAIPRKKTSQVQYANRRFCSLACRKTAGDTRIGKSTPMPCQGCGKIGYNRIEPLCSDCMKASKPAPRPRIWTPERDTFIKENYPSKGGAYCAEQLGLPHKGVVIRASRLGVNLSKEATRRIVNTKAKEHMLSDNPMKRESVKAKQKQFWADNPDKRAMILAAFHRGQAELQRRKISKLEVWLRAILDNIGIAYEPSVEIKPNFLVDIRIGKLIIQADGDYWHGHSRFEPLTERQEKQKRKDAAQDEYLRTCGYAIARIWESDMSAEAVLNILRQHGVNLPSSA